MSYPLFHPRAVRQHPSALTPDDFASEFAGEGRFLEFKEGFSRREVARTVVAFSNDEGGVLILGVADGGTVRGFPLNGEREAEIHATLAEVNNPGRYEIVRFSVGDRALVAVAVDRRREGFAQTRDGQVLVRRGASNRALIGSELAEFVARRYLSRFETTPTEADFERVDDELLRGLADAWSWRMDDVVDRLREQRLVCSTSDGDRLTVAGCLYLLRSPHAVLGKSLVEVFRYRDDGTTYDRRVEVTGPLPDQVEGTTRLVLDEIGSELVVLGIRRYELPRIPAVVLREAIANAVAHRSYEAKGTSVRVEIRPDRIVVSSPGGLPEPVTVRNIREQSSARNLAVINTLRRYRLAEDAGRGVDVMQDEMASNLLAAPEFVDDGSQVTVTLRLSPIVTPVERAWIAEMEQRGRLAPRDRLLLVHAARGAVLTNSRARALLGVDSVEARAALQRLRDEGFLTQQGTRGGAVYRVSAGLGPPPGLRMTYEDLESLILDLAAERPVTNALVRERTGLDRVAARRVLARLVADGRLQQVGERRGTRYVRRS